jgi:hypothetical protein
MTIHGNEVRDRKGREQSCRLDNLQGQAISNRTTLASVFRHFLDQAADIEIREEQALLLEASGSGLSGTCSGNPSCIVYWKWSSYITLSDSA